MNLDLIDDMSGLILHERENSFSSDIGIRNAEEHNSPQTSRFPRNTPLAMAYVPFQQWGEVFDDDKALRCGTLFPDLVFPFERGGSDDE